MEKTDKETENRERELEKEHEDWQKEKIRFGHYLRFLRSTDPLR